MITIIYQYVAFQMGRQNDLLPVFCFMILMLGGYFLVPKGRGRYVGSVCVLMIILFQLSCRIADAAPHKASRGPADKEQGVLYSADRVFDGSKFLKNTAILVVNDKVERIGSIDELSPYAKQVHRLQDSTILPGFIELHAHLMLRKVPPEVVLRHGVTTLRDVGGPLAEPSGGDGKLRILTAGPIITVQKGYPISVFGKGYIAEPVDDIQQARSLVRRLIDKGAAVIKIAIEPGGEAGAPWSAHDHAKTSTPWPIPALDLVKAIVEEAHEGGRITTAHVGEKTGAAIAVAAGVDEWAHIPCDDVDDETLRRAADRKVRIVTTLDTMSHCRGAFNNGRKLAGFGVRFLYGAEIAHTDVPWGIDARELELMHHILGMSFEEVLSAATSEAGKELGSKLLGSLSPGAPADLIAVKGDASRDFKLLEYPALVVSGGKIIVNEYQAAGIKPDSGARSPHKH